MNATRWIVAVAAMTAAGSLFAEHIYPFPEQRPFVSTKTRAQVQEELAQARAQGLIRQGEATDSPAGSASTTRIAGCDTDASRKHC